MLALVDTNVLVYKYDPRFPDKQRKAEEVLRRGIEERSIRLPHQAIIEFVAVVTRPSERIRRFSRRRTLAARQRRC